MTDRPIIFSASMVRALLDGRKTMTRRVLKDQPGDLDRPFMMDDGSWHVVDSQGCHMSPLDVRWRRGDRLWVREAIVHAPMGAGFDTTHWPHGTVAYLADGKGEWFDRAKAAGAKSRPSIHMPRWASRLTLIVEDVRVERLQEISEADARAEGMFERSAIGDDPQHPTWTWQREGWRYDTPRTAFAALWASLHGPDAWAANPWVAAIAFRVIRANIDNQEARA